MVVNPPYLSRIALLVFFFPLFYMCRMFCFLVFLLKMIRVVAQMVGGFYAFPIMAKLLPSYATASMGGPTLAAGASTGEGMAWEFGSTLALILIVYAAATQVTDD